MLPGVLLHESLNKGFCLTTGREASRGNDLTSWIKECSNEESAHMGGFVDHRVFGHAPTWGANGQTPWLSPAVSSSAPLSSAVAVAEDYTGSSLVVWASSGEQEQVIRGQGVLTTHSSTPKIGETRQERFRQVYVASLEQQLTGGPHELGT